MPYFCNACEKTHDTAEICKEKIPSREWLLGWFAGCIYSGLITQPYSSIEKRSRASLWKLFKKITGEN